MKWFRKKQKKILLFLAVFITFSLVVGSLGLNFVRSSPMDAVSIVNGEKIPYKRFTSLYQQVLDNQRERNPEPLSEPQRQYLKNQVLQLLVQEEILVQEAKKLGILVSDMELAQTIQAVPAFQRDGRFDPAAYQTVLNRHRLKVEEFEETQRRQILGQKAQMLMSSGIKISSLEAPRAFQEVLAQASLEDRKKLMGNPEELREQVRRREVQASLQEWYTVLNTQIKVKMLLNQIEGEPASAPAA